jgi:hypothetical protein
MQNGLGSSWTPGLRLCQATKLDSPAESNTAMDFWRGETMKVRFSMAIAATLFAGTLAMAADSSLTGWISDSQCGVKGANEKAGECTTKCVKEHGAKYVFVNDADKKVYVVDAQDKVAEHAGHHVTVKGTVEGDTLKLTSIEMAAK